MNDKTYFILAMIFDHWWKVALFLLLLIGWSDVYSCETVMTAEVIEITCEGCK